MHVFFPTELVQYPRIGWFTRKYQSIISPGLLLAGLLLKVAILSKKLQISGEKNEKCQKNQEKQRSNNSNANSKNKSKHKKKQKNRKKKGKSKKKTLKIKKFKQKNI